MISSRESAQWPLPVTPSELSHAVSRTGTGLFCFYLLENVLMDDYQIDILRLASQGYCCVQIPLLLVLEAHGRQNHGLMRALSPLCHGFPDASGTCGSLIGGACVLGYFAGKGEPGSDADERLPLMLEELTEWFKGRTLPQFGGLKCSDIVKSGQPEPTICGGLIADTHLQALSILVENGFDPNEDPFDD